MYDVAPPHCALRCALHCVLIGGKSFVQVLTYCLLVLCWWWDGVMVRCDQLHKATSFGKMDPRVDVKYGAFENKTIVVKNGHTTPEFNTVFEFPVRHIMSCHVTSSLELLSDRV